MYSRGQVIAKLVHGLNQLPCQNSVGDILITSVKNEAYNSNAFADKLRKFKRGVLMRLVKKGVSVVTRSDKGRLHCHIACAMPESCIDFDWISFDEAERYFILYQKYKDKPNLRFYRYYTSKYRRSMPLSWQLINHKLMGAGKRHGLGRVFLTPIRKNMTAYKWYLVGNVPYKREERDKSLHFFSSWGLETANQFQVLNKYTTLYRRKLKKFAEGLCLTSDSYNIILRSLFGRHWYYRIKYLINAMDNLTPDQFIQYEQLKKTMQTHRLRSNE